MFLFNILYENYPIFKIVLLVIKCYNENVYFRELYFQNVKNWNGENHGF